MAGEERIQSIVLRRVSTSCCYYGKTNYQYQ